MKWKVGDILEYRPEYDTKINYVIYLINKDLITIKTPGFTNTYSYKYLTHYLQLKRPACPVKRELSRVNLP